MKYLILAITLTVSLNSMAQFKIGLYEGQYLTGKACSVYFQSKNFRYNIQNPVNEEVTVKVNTGEIFITSYHTQYDELSNTINYEKNVLSHFRGTKLGAIGLRIVMEEIEGSDSPSRFVLITNNWAEGTQRRQECSNLIYRGLDH